MRVKEKIGEWLFYRIDAIYLLMGFDVEGNIIKVSNIFARFICRMGVREGKFTELTKNIFKYESNE